MGNGMSKVVPGLFVGNFRDSQDEEQLRNNNITHIISIHDNAKKKSDLSKSNSPSVTSLQNRGAQSVARSPQHACSPREAAAKRLAEIAMNKEYLCITAFDSPQQNLTQFFPQCNDFIHEARGAGGSVLVHCLAGVSRSATIAVAYLMTVTSLNHKDALKAVRGARQVANPNTGFQSQLQDFDWFWLNNERKRLQRKFPYRFDSDDSDCRKLIAIYNSTIRPRELHQPSICRSVPGSPMPMSPRRKAPHRRSIARH